MEVSALIRSLKPGPGGTPTGSGYPATGPIRRRCGSRTRRRLGRVLFAAVLLTAAAAGAGDDAGSAGEAGRGEALKRSRLEFDERLIMGQSLKSGAIYLFDRKDSQIHSMVKVRKDFREELLSPLEPSY